MYDNWDDLKKVLQNVKNVDYAPIEPTLFWEKVI